MMSTHRPSSWLSDSLSPASTGTVEAERDTLGGYYAELSGHPSRARQAGWRGRADQVLRFAVCAQALPLTEVRSVLDVGCGLGDFAPFLRQLGFHGRYLGVDVLPEMVRQAVASHPGEEYICADLSSSPEVAVGPWDLVVACGTLALRVPKHEDYVRRTLAAVWRRTLGAMVVVVPAARGQQYTPTGEDIGELVHYRLAALRALLMPFSSSLVMREDFLTTDVAAYAYREGASAHDMVAASGLLSAAEMAELYLERELVHRAVEVLEGASNEERDTPAWWLRRGQALRALGRAEEALAALDEALSREPEFVAARLEREGVIGSR